MEEDEQEKIEALDIKRGDKIRFKVKPWLAERVGLYYGVGNENIGVDIGVVDIVTDSSVHINYCEIHDKRDIWLAKSQFIYVYRYKNWKRKDWFKEK